AGMDWAAMRTTLANSRGGAIAVGRSTRACPAGAFVARAMAIATIDPQGRLWHDALAREADCRDAHLAESLDWAWWTGGWALVLADVAAIHPVPWRGQLGIWTVPREAALLVRASRA